MERTVERYWQSVISYLLPLILVIMPLIFAVIQKNTSHKKLFENLISPKGN
jgi:hypothetical protein